LIFGCRTRTTEGDDMIDLSKFCSVGRFSTPWTAGAYTYASNGHIVVRVPRREDVLGRLDAPDTKKICDILLREPTKWEQVPGIIASAPIKCGRCYGAGIVYVCPECDGEGDVSFSNGYSHYTVPCDTCDGEEVVPIPKSEKKQDCGWCDGTGMLTEHRSVPLGCSYFSDVYLALIASALPGAEIGPLGEKDPARIRFEGGDGLLMPRIDHS